MKMINLITSLISKWVTIVSKTGISESLVAQETQSFHVLKRAEHNLKEEDCCPSY